MKQYFGQRKRLAAILAYGLANSAPGMTSAVLLLIYTSAFNVGDFGRYGVFTATCAFIGIVADLGMPTAILRFYHDKRYGGASHISSTIAGYRFLLLLVLPLLGIAVYYFWPFTGDSANFRIIAILLCISYFERSGELLGAVCRAAEKPGYFATGKFLNAATTISISIIVVMIFKGGVTGALLARLCGAIAAWLSYRILTENALGIGMGKFRWSDLKVWLTFGLPVVPTKFAIWSQQLALRPTLARLVPIQQVGLFTLASGVASVPLLVGTTFDAALAPIYYKRRSENSIAFSEALEKIGQVFVATQFAMWAALILFTPEIIRLAAGFHYVSAAPICALLFCTSFLRCLNPFMIRQLNFLNLTWLTPIIVIPCATISPVFTVAFVGKYGILAAAWGILISETVMLIVLAIAIKAHERVHLSLPVILLCLALLFTLAIWVFHGRAGPVSVPTLALRAGIAVFIVAISGSFWIWPNRAFILRLASG